MRSITLFLSATVLAVALVGCGNDSDRPDEQTRIDTDRQEAVQAMETRLQRIDQKLDQMTDRVGDAAGEAGDDAQRELTQTRDELAAEQRVLEQKLAQARDASDDDWQKTRQDIEDSLDDLSSRVDRAWNDLTGT